MPSAPTMWLQAHSKRLLITVEEEVEDLAAPLNAIVLPAHLIAAVSVVPGGAYPSYAHGYYDRDNSFYKDWDEIARRRESFRNWMDKHVLGTATHVQLLRMLGVAS